MSNTASVKKLIHCEEYIPVGGGGTKTLTKTEPNIFAQHTLVEVYLDLDDLWHF